MSRTAITLKFKMRWFPDEASYWAETLCSNVNLPILMPDEDKNFGGSLVLDFRKWWHHVQAKNWFLWSYSVFIDPLRRGNKEMINPTASFESFKCVVVDLAYRKSLASRSIKYAPSRSSAFNSNLPENIAHSMESGSFLRVSSVVL